MMSIEFFSYFLLLSIYLFLFSRIWSSLYSKDITSGIHYGLMSLIALQGLSSMAFGLMGLGLTLNRINFATLAAILAAAIWSGANRQGDGMPAARQHLRKEVFSSYIISFLIAFIAGIFFYTVDLIPSAMSGDPARHFIQIIEPTKMHEAAIYKPIYYLWAGIFINSNTLLEKDQLFLVFNIFLLGLCTSSCLLLFTNLFPSARMLTQFTVALLVCLGYPFFLLQYGNYTLLLSSAFLFSMMALLIDYKDIKDIKLYFVITIMTIGVVLSHSYLTPDALLALIGFAVWNAARKGENILISSLRHSPFWIVIVLIATASNKGVIGSAESIARLIITRGFINESIFLNMLPFAPFAAIYLFINRKSETAQIIMVLIAAVATFSFIMGYLHMYGAALYYINRNQIILLPLLVIATAALIQKLELRRPAFARFIQISIAATIVAPYLLIQNSPLSINTTKFRELLLDDKMVYLENAINFSFSPLQMTKFDRALMRNIGLSRSNCLEGSIDKVAALDLDQEVIWFHMYTGIYPSLFPRDDGFVSMENYLQNYEEWKSNPSNLNIVVFRNFDFWRQEQIVSDLKSRATLVCKGDSIEIYRK